MSVMIRMEGSGGKIQECCAMYSLRMSFWIVPVIRIVSHEGGKVERHREAGLPLAEQVMVPGVGVLRRPEPGELAHGPEAPPVHRGLDSAGVRVFSGEPHVVQEFEVQDVQWRVEGRDLLVGDRGKTLTPLGRPGKERPQPILFPSLPVFPYSLRLLLFVHDAIPLLLHRSPPTRASIPLAE